MLYSAGTGWCHKKLLPFRRALCTPYNHAPCHFMQNHIRKVYACLAVACHLHFWQNDRDLLRATAVLTMTMPTSFSCSHVREHCRKRCLLMSSNCGWQCPLLHCGQGHVRFWPQAITAVRAVSVMWPGLRASLVLSNDGGRVCV